MPGSALSDEVFDVFAFATFKNDGGAFGFLAF